MVETKHNPVAPELGGLGTVDMFTAIQIRGLTIRNRIMLSPMCMYHCENKDGVASDFHVMHYGTRALGGTGIVCVEATAVEPKGRISPQDLGIWGEEHVEPLKRVTNIIKENGAVPAIQLAHAGRKAATYRPWGVGNKRGPIPEDESWELDAPSSIAWDTHYPTPRELTVEEIKEKVNLFKQAAERALAAGFQIIEIHGAHGYLIHEFLSPVTNKRTDSYGGSFENRISFLLEIVDAVRSVWPEDLPVFLRISADDWHERGWTPEDSARLAQVVKEHGVDLVDCSAGAISNDVKYPASLGHQGYQVYLAEKVKKEGGGVLSGAVGGIKEAAFADSIVKEGKADIVIIGRQMLADPFWPNHAAVELKQRERLDYAPVYRWAIK